MHTQWSLVTPQSLGLYSGHRETTIIEGMSHRTNEAPAPSGLFAAASLLKTADSAEDIDVAVDMVEMLPTPWGLARSGFAPDYQGHVS